jgi:ankyrin repeat protein
MLVIVLLAASVSAAPPDRRLIDTVKASQTSAVRTLLQQRVDPNSADPDGTTALHWAAQKNNVEIADVLIHAGANAKAANRYGVTPLSLAATNGNAAMLELLLKSGADPNTKLAYDETVLMTASRTGVADAVGVLLRHGADVNAKESWRGQTALMWAAAEGNLATVELLLKAGADLHARENGGFTPLLFAVRQGKIDVLRALLNAGASAGETLNKPRRGGDPTIGSSAVVLAVENAHFEIASLLLDAGADPNAAAQGWTALHEITWVRKPGTGSNDPAPAGSGSIDSLEMVRRLVKHGANVNARVTRRPSAGLSSLNTIGGTPFLLAARTGDAELMRLLASLGADPKMPNEDGTTPLMVAAGVGTRSPGEDAGTESEVYEAVQVALEFGNDPNAVDKNGETAMHGAAYKHVASVVPLLMEHGAKIEVFNHNNKSGWTPLRIAEGVHRGMNLRASPETAAALRKFMSAAGVSTEVEPEPIISGATK